MGLDSGRLRIVMPTQLPSPEEITQACRLDDFLSGGSQTWTTVYAYRAAGIGYNVFSVFIAPSQRNAVLSRPEWEMRPCGGAPAFTQDRLGRSRYTRHGVEGKLRPVVILQDHNGVLPRMPPQVLEEFRHFHNLWEDPGRGLYKRVLSDGTEETVCEISADRVRIRTALLRQFQAATQLCLVRCMETIHNAPNRHQWTAACLAHLNSTVRAKDYMWDRNISLAVRPGQTSSHLRAKTVVGPPPRSQCGVWPWDTPDDDAFPHRCFIVNETPTGAPVEHTCDPEALTPFPGASDALLLGQMTPIFFGKKVLQRYYDEPQKYQVEDNHLRCGGLWSLQIDNNQPEYVVVLLHELGTGLPKSEQDHWRLHNVTPPGSGLSDAAAGRWIHGEWTQPDSPEWHFKHHYLTFRDCCRGQLRWDLWCDANDADGNPLLRTVRMPLTETAEALGEQARLLHLLLIERLNLSAVRDALEASPSSNQQRLALLEAWLEQIGYSHTTRDMQLLHRIRRLRNAAAHGDDIIALLEQVGLPGDPWAAACALFKDAATMLQDLTDAVEAL